MAALADPFWPYASRAWNVNVEDPVWPAVTARLAEQDRTDEPQSEDNATPELGSNALLLLAAVTDSAPAPATVNITGAAELPTVKDCVAPAVMLRVGAGGFVTVMVALAEVAWPYVSVATSVTVEDPAFPGATAIVAEHERAVEPQLALMEIAEFGTRAGLLLTAVTVSGPVPSTVNTTGAAIFPALND